MRGGPSSSPRPRPPRCSPTCSKSVKVTFVAKFANGFAHVTIELRSEGGAMKLWRLQVDGQENLLRQQQSKAQPIARV